ncbi:MAG: SCO family protein [Pseudohongiellaceae bacterium]
MALSVKAKRGLIAFAIFDAAVIAALIFLFILRAQINTKDELRELGVTVYPDVRPVQEFQLVDENLSAYTEANLKNQWTLLFFGFTSCPDICPLTMAELKKFYEQMSDEKMKNELNIVMISVDPERDSPEQMGEYVNRFNEDFLGVTGSVDSIAAVAAQFFVAYSEPEPEAHAEHGDHMNTDTASAEDNYLISHSGHIAVVNPDGNYHGVMRPPHRARDLAKAYQMLIDSSGF